MDIQISDFSVKKGEEQMHFEEIVGLLHQSYWAKDRAKEVIEKSMKNSICYGIFESASDIQVGFARVITDYATTYYMCDVIIDEKYRGKGLGNHLLEAIEQDNDFCYLRGVLATRDAHELYSKFGFENGGNMFMQKSPRR